MTPADGGAAFPSQLREARDPGDHDPQAGMSLRDWFAGQALAGLAASPMDMPAEAYGLTAYTIADAMLAERAR